MHTSSIDQVGVRPGRSTGSGPSPSTRDPRGFEALLDALAEPGAPSPLRWRAPSAARIDACPGRGLDVELAMRAASVPAIATAPTEATPRVAEAAPVLGASGPGLAPERWMAAPAATGARASATAARPTSRGGQLGDGRFVLLHPRLGPIESDLSRTTGPGADAGAVSLSVLVAPQALATIAGARDRIERAVGDAAGAPVTLRIRAGTIAGVDRGTD